MCPTQHLTEALMLVDQFNSMGSLKRNQFLHSKMHFFNCSRVLMQSGYIVKYSVWCQSAEQRERENATVTTRNT